MTHSIKDTVSAVKEKIVSGTALLFQTIQICRGVLRLPYKNGYLSTVCCDIAINKINGIVDTMIFNFDEYFKCNDPEQQFYVWEKLDEIKWNGNINPTVKEIKKFNNEIIEFINMYSEGTNFIAFVS